METSALAVEKFYASKRPKNKQASKCFVGLAGSMIMDEIFTSFPEPQDVERNERL